MPPRRSDNAVAQRRVYTGDTPVPITDYSISQARSVRLGSARAAAV